jgi:methyl-accepting chemotaxis protein
VERQGAATPEIARTVQQTSQTPQEVTTHRRREPDRARDGCGGGTGAAAASDLSQQAAQLSGEVNAFVAGVRTG